MGPNPQEIADLITFTKEILNGKLHFLYSKRYNSPDHFIIVQIVPGYMFVQLSQSVLPI